MAFDGPWVGEDRLGEGARLILIGSPCPFRLLDVTGTAAHPDDAADGAGQTGEAEREHGSPTAVDADRGRFLGGEGGDHLGDLLLHGMFRGQVGGGVGADGAGGGEERRVLAGAVEVQGRARVSVLSSLGSRSLLQFTAEGTIGGVGGGALQVGHAQPGGLQHRGHDRHMSGFGLVRGHSQCRGPSLELCTKAHRRDRLQRFETRPGEHGNIRGTQADQR